MRDGQTAGGHDAVCGCFGGGRCIFAVAVREGEGERWGGAEYCKVIDECAPQLAQLPYLFRDNCPKSFNSKAGFLAEAQLREQVGVVTVPLPKRSPNVMPLDYTFHDEVRRRMRGQERGWARDFRETREQFKERLLATYSGIDQATIDKGCGDMYKRIESMYQCGGTAAAIN